MVSISFGGCFFAISEGAAMPDGCLEINPTRHSRWLTAFSGMAKGQPSSESYLRFDGNLVQI